MFQEFIRFLFALFEYEDSPGRPETRTLGWGCLLPIVALAVIGVALRMILR